MSFEVARIYMHNHNQVGASVSALRMPDAAPEANGAEENRPENASRPPLAPPAMPAQGGGGTARGGLHRLRR